MTPVVRFWYLANPKVEVKALLTYQDGSEAQNLQASHVHEALIDSEERLRLAVEAAGIGSWDWETTAGSVTLSDRLLALHGYGAGGFGGTYQAYLDCIHPADRDVFADAMLRAIQDHTDLDLEYRIMLPSGGVRWIAAKGRPRYDTAGNLVRFLGMGIEVTRQKRTEEALRFLSRSSELLSETLDYETVLQRVAALAVPVLADWCAVDLVEVDGSIQRLAVTHADPSKEEVARRLKDYVPDQDKSAPLIEVLRSGRSILQPDLPDAVLVAAALDEEHLRIMRSLQFSSVMIVPLLSMERTLGALTLMAGESGRRYDADDLALAEDLARRAALAIDNAVMYREAQLNAEELRKANAAKDEFLGLVSHELKTPITTILGNAELLYKRAGLLNEETQAEALVDMRNDAARLNRVIDNLLVLARVDYGAALDPEPFALVPAIKRLCNEHSRRNHNRDVIVQSDPEVRPVIAQAGHVELVLRNLLSNAEKYSSADRPIEVDVRPSGVDVLVSVRDRGVGIPADELSSVFTAFYRSSKTPSDRKGFGIGLAVCKRLLEAQGGRVWARARDGGGSEFVFTLPTTPEESMEP